MRTETKPSSVPRTKSSHRGPSEATRKERQRARGNEKKEKVRNGHSRLTDARTDPQNTTRAPPITSGREDPPEVTY